MAFKGLSIYEMTTLDGGGEHVLVDEQHGALVQVEADDHVVVENSRFGPCEIDDETRASEYPSKPKGRGTAAYPCGGADNKVLERAANVVLRHNLFDEFTIEHGHGECLFVKGGDNVVIEGNRFQTCQLYGIFLQPGSGSPIENLTMQNNWFANTESASNPGPVGHRDTALTFGIHESLTVDHVLISYNSFGAEESATNEEGTRDEPKDTKVIGNIQGTTVECQAGFTYSYNFFTGSLESCGVGAVGAVPYVSDARTSPDYTLTSGATAAKGLVEDREASDQVEWDYYGNRRSSTGPWNAGAAE